jgi:nicotinate-nucleotide pyrophosphorylase (carboxylating)
VPTLDPTLVERLVRAALAEDLEGHDATTEAVVPAGLLARATFLAKQDLFLAGLEVALTAFRVLDPDVSWQPRAVDGAPVRSGETLGRLEGRARALLSAERVALNFLQRLTGIATLTRRFVEAVAGTGARIRDTRKTTPLLRALEKYAVEVGGGVPHRGGLARGILVKDNHVRLAGSVEEAARRAARQAGGLPFEVEIERLDQLEGAIGGGAQMVLVDNFTPEAVREAVARTAGRVPIEVSGGVRLETVRAYAEAGADFIAVGALTHSAPAADISLEIEPLPAPPR